MKIWTVSESKIGTSSQCLAVAKFLSPRPSERTFEPNRNWRRVFDGPLFVRWEKEPNLVISCGFRAEKRVMKIKQTYRSRPFTVHLQEPLKPGYDLVFVSRHGWRPEFDARPNYHQMLGVPHRFSAAFWDNHRHAARSIYAPNGEKVVTVFLGGSNGAYVYDDASHRNIAHTVKELAGRGWRVLISVSRRSSAETLAALLPLNSSSVTVWDRISANPFIDYVAAADAFLIAKDSVTMPCEALSTGRPVYALDLTAAQGERYQKFEQYHHDLQANLNLTRRYEGSLDAYDYEPPAEAERISNIIRSALQSAKGQ